ncbi:MAG: DUF1559 domain-containing protein [Planctomycetaceae bacterium]|nr:DUF1559 domain-containing protein [Planctomycetaceae bacterium]
MLQADYDPLSIIPLAVPNNKRNALTMSMSVAFNNRHDIATPEDDDSSRQQGMIFHRISSSFADITDGLSNTMAIYF